MNNFFLKASEKYVVLRQILNQYSETNVRHFLVSLLIIKGLNMFRALFAHPKEALNERHLVYCVRVMSVGCYQDWSGTGVEDTHAIYEVPLVERLPRVSK
jgi:hypothetical protein